MVRFIDQHRAQYGVEPICRVVPIAPSTYFLRKAQQQDPTKRSARAQRDDDAARRDSARLGRQLAGLWAAEGLEAAAARGPPRRALHRGAPDAGHGPCGRGARARVDDHDAGRRRRRAAGGSGRAAVRRDAAESALGRGLHLRRDLARLRLRRVRHRRLCASHRRLARLGVAAHRLRPRCARTGHLRPLRRDGARRWSITATAARSTCRCATPTAWPTPASSPPSAAGAIPTTTRWPNRSSACSRRK